MNNIAEIKKLIEKNVSRLATKDLVAASKSIIENFYNSYSPLVYERDPNLKLRGGYYPLYGNTYGGVNVTIGEHDGDVDTLMWMNGIRGLPAQSSVSDWVNPNYMTFETIVDIDGISFSAATPDAAMEMLVNGEWEKAREKEINNIIDKALDGLELF